MASPVNLRALIRKQPKDIVAAFEAKGMKISGDWHEMWQEAHAKAFTVANVARADVLLEIRAEMERAIALGIPERSFVSHLKPRMKALGWWGEVIEVDPAGSVRRIQLGSSHRLKFIYRQNMQTAYMAGRWKTQKENADARPWWQYVAVLDSKTRPQHRALSGRIFRHDDPFWDAFYPPNGWNCRCRVRTLSNHGLKAAGLKAETSDGKIATDIRDIAVNKRTGEIALGEVKTFRYQGVDGKSRLFSPDAGWSYNPGSAAYGSDRDMLRKLTMIDDVTIRAQAIQSINNAELRHTQFSNWVGKVLTNRVARTSTQVVGIMDDTVAAAVRDHGQEPARVLVLTDRTLLTKGEKTTASRTSRGMRTPLPAPVWQQLPTIIATGDVYWDIRHGNVVYVAAAGDKAYKIIVRAPSIVKGKGALDAVVTALMVSVQSLNDPNMFTPLRIKNAL